MADAVRLPSRLDLAAASPLAHTLRGCLSADGGALNLDASAVTQLGGLCLQVLLAAAAECASQSRRFRIEPRSAAFEQAVAQFGIPAASLHSEHI